MFIDKIKQSLSKLYERILWFAYTILVILRLKKNQKMLSYYIYSFKKKNRKPESKRFRANLYLKKAKHWMLSKYSVALLISAAILALLWIAPINQIMGGFLNLKLTPEFFQSYFQTLWQVQAAIIGITFVIIILLLQMLTSKIENEYEEISGRLIQEFAINTKTYVVLAFCLLSTGYIGVTLLFSSIEQTYQNLYSLLLIFS